MTVPMQFIPDRTGTQIVAEPAEIVPVEREK